MKSANLLAISNANCLIATAMAFNLWNLARRFLVLLDNLSNNITKMEHKTERNKKREETRREHKEHTESKFFTSFTINLAELFPLKQFMFLILDKSYTLRIRYTKPSSSNSQKYPSWFISSILSS